MRQGGLERLPRLGRVLRPVQLLGLDRLDLLVQLGLADGGGFGRLLGQPGVGVGQRLERVIDVLLGGGIIRDDGLGMRHGVREGLPRVGRVLG